MKFNVRKLLDVPQFEFKTEEKQIIKQWREVLGNTKPKRKYKPPKGAEIICTHQYFDKGLGRTVKAGEHITVPEERAELIVRAGYGRRG
jgi:hypothetical protein